MSRLTVVIGAAAALAVVVALAALGVWYFFIRSDSPAPVSLEAALTAAATHTSATPATAEPAGLAGTWSIVSGETSFVGYRVQEELAGFGANTAVGRTSNVQGTLAYDGSKITSVNVTADLTTLQSDKSQRDGQLRRQAIETDTYPTAAFELTTPIAVDTTPQQGTSVTKTVQGNLTLHGVTRTVSIDVQGQLQNGQLIVVGSTAITFADYNIAKPTSFAVVSVEDHGTMEFQLVFSKSA